MNQQLFQSLYQQKQYGQLITAFESPQNNLKTDALVNSLYLNALRHRGYTDNAHKGYERLYKKMSHLPFVVNGFGNLLIATNQFERAVEVYKKGIVQIGPQFEFYFNAGRALQRSSQFVTAQQYFTQSLQLNPNAFEARREQKTYLRLLRRYGRRQKAATGLKALQRLHGRTEHPGT